MASGAACPCVRRQHLIMNTGTLTLLFSIFSLATATCGAADQEKLKAELVRTESEFFQHALEHGFTAGLHAYMAEDGFVANSLILGRDAQAAKVRAEKEPSRSRGNIIRWKPLRAEVADSGDLGYTYGAYELKKGDLVIEHGTYVRVWKKQRVVIDVMSPDPKD